MTIYEAVYGLTRNLALKAAQTYRTMKIDPQTGMAVGIPAGMQADLGGHLCWVEFFCCQIIPPSGKH